MLILISLLKKLMQLIGKSKKDLILELLILRKENEIYTRQQIKRRQAFTPADKLFLVTIPLLGFMKNKITIVRPDTLLRWHKQYIAKQWIFPHKKRGRPAVTSKIKAIILRLKTENHTWGAKKIQGELIKLNIQLSTKTIRKIISTFRKNGKIKPGLS